MTASFPLATKRFTVKRNLLDDVNASHINDIQSEISAIEDVLGANPHQDLLTTDPGWRWTTLKSRLEYMIRGRHIPCFSLYNANPATLATDQLIQRGFPAPAAGMDTHKLFSGSSIKVKRAGWYDMNASVFFNASSLKGNRILQIRSATKGARVNSGYLLTDTNSQPDGLWLNASWTGYVAAGEQMGLWVNLNTGAYPNGRYTIRYAGLNGHLVRDA